VHVLEAGQQIFRNLGLTDQPDFDIFTAIVASLINQQLANDPAAAGGRRWSTGRSIFGPTASTFHQTQRRETCGQLNHRARIAEPLPQGAP
jgi:hypothetical protein